VLRYYYINKEWMLSATAQRIYRLAASLSLALFFIWFGLMLAGGIPATLRPLVRAVVFVCVVGAAATMVAMEYFLFGFDESPAWKKVFWFGVMLFPPLGPPLYCFFVYSRSEVVKRGYKLPEKLVI